MPERGPVPKDRGAPAVLSSRVLSKKVHESFLPKGKVVGTAEVWGAKAEMARNKLKSVLSQNTVWWPRVLSNAATLKAMKTHAKPAQDHASET